MSEKNTVEVKILEKEYLVACPEDTRHELQSAAHYLDAKMREIRASGKIFGTERIAVMAALNITHQMLNGTQNNETAEKFVQSLSQKLDQILEKTAS
jgi:cell division protein ZapA